jgi:diguanylate cyclase (GGDEF)-like protein
MLAADRQEALDALRAYLDAESGRDLQAVLAHLADEHCGFGTGPDEIVLDVAEVRAILVRQFAETSRALEHHVELMHSVDLGADACLFMAVITYHVEIGGVVETLAPRFTFVMRRDRGRFGLVHLHASLPWSLQQPGESFPLREYEERQRQLERLVAERTAELHRTLELLQKLATTDKLTGLHNRAKLDELISDEHRFLTRHPRASSIAILDLDHFKAINDTHGHLVGDRVLHEVAGVLAGTVRAVDRVGRWGGEEFLVLMPETGAEGARLVAQRMQEALAQRDFGVSSPVTLSVGIAAYRPGEGVSAWISRADEMLYQAKNGGRNRILLDP